MKVVNLTKTCPTIKELQQSFLKVKELCILETSKEFWSMDSTWLTSLEASRYVVMNKLLLLKLLLDHLASCRHYLGPENILSSSLPLHRTLRNWNYGDFAKKISVESSSYGSSTATAVCGSTTLNLQTLSSKYEFSFAASIRFLQKQWGEVDKISGKFILCDHVRNSHDHLVLQSIDITRINLMLITLRA